MYYNADSKVYLDGKIIPAKEAQTDLYAQTLQYGSGVFEGIRSYETPDGVRIFKAKEHYERLKYSAKSMHMPFPWTVDELTKISYELLEINQLKDAYDLELETTLEKQSLNPFRFEQTELSVEDVKNLFEEVCCIIRMNDPNAFGIKQNEEGKLETYQSTSYSAAYHTFGSGTVGRT